jgi:hypothetical protein
MFNPFARARNGARRQLARPALEALECRDCPTMLGAQPAQQLWYLLNTSASHAPSAPVMKPNMLMGDGGGGGPVITLNLTYNTQKSVTLSGTVVDSSSVAGLTVTFAGEVASTTTTDSNGNFSLTTDAQGLGTVSASAVDTAQRQSNVAKVIINVAAPVISNFTATEGAEQVFTFTGDVSAQSPQGLIVTLGGIPSLANQTATVQADGSFSLSVQLQSDGSDNGTATARVLSDWWGQASNVATTSVFVSS